ncbi:MAG: hypothetical protein ABI666_08585 [Ferruginibacter sp.]
MKKTILVLLISTAAPLLIKAQVQKILQSKWVKIMQNDSLGNYIEAEKDFQKFYTAYLKKEAKELKERSNAGEAHLESQEELLIAGYIKWSVAIKPFVRYDGSIMPIDERMVIINDANKNRHK